MRTILISTAVAVLLATSSQAQAYGAYRSSYTTCGAGGVQHSSTAAAVGPYGGAAVHSSTSYAGGGTVTTNAVGGAGYAGGSRAYSPTMYSGYSAVGVAGGGYGAGVVRAGYVR